MCAGTSRNRYSLEPFTDDLGNSQAGMKQGTAIKNSTGYFIDGRSVTSEEYFAYGQRITNPPQNSGDDAVIQRLERIEAGLDAIGQRLDRIERRIRTHGTLLLQEGR